MSQRILPRLAKRMHKKPSRQFMHTFSAILPLQIGSEITHDCLVLTDLSGHPIQLLLVQNHGIRRAGDNMSAHRYFIRSGKLS